MSHDTCPIVVGLDGSPSSIQALRHAVELGSALAAPLRVVTAWQQPTQAEAFELGAVYDAAAAAHGVQREALTAAIDLDAGHFERAVTEGASASVLIAESAHARMLVVGSRGHSGLTGLLLGSVSSACAERASCPVLVVH